VKSPKNSGSALYINYRRQRYVETGVKSSKNSGFALYINYRRQRYIETGEREPKEFRLRVVF